MIPSLQTLLPQLRVKYLIGQTNLLTFSPALESVPILKDTTQLCLVHVKLYFKQQPEYEIKMSVNTALRRRQLGLKRRINIDFLVDKIRLKEAFKMPNCSFDELDPNQGSIPSSGPLASTRLNSDTLAMANEDGRVHLIGTRKLQSKTHWVAHDNAIFDIKTTVDCKSLITASGDNTIRVWDVEKKRETLNFNPHFSSIKSISVYDANTIASGSRDGSIKIHDLRVKNKTVIIIRDAHRNTTFRKAPPKLGTKTDPVSCVTNVLFDPCSPRLYSAGANDATIKLWDLRKTGNRNRPRRTREGHVLLNQPFQEVRHPTHGIHCGYSQLLLSSGRLYASCSDNKIYCYDGLASSTVPRRFWGYTYNTYVKMAVIDDRFLISGTKSGGGAQVWSLGDEVSTMSTKQPIGQLTPDTNDKLDTNVIEADWESLSVFSMREDGLICKWTLQHVPESERKRLVCDNSLATLNEDITIQMADVIDVDVLRPSQRINHPARQHALVA